MIAAGLLVGEQAQDHVSRRGSLARAGAHERRQHHRHPALHVERSPSPDVAVVKLARERLVPPAAHRRDDVEVALQQQRRGPAAAPQPRDQVRPLRGVARAPAPRSRCPPAARGSMPRTRPRRPADSSCRSGAAAAAARPVGPESPAAGHRDSLARISRGTREFAGLVRKRLQVVLLSTCPAQCGPERSASGWSPCP